MEDVHLCYLIKVQFTACYDVSLTTRTLATVASLVQNLNKEKRFTLTKKNSVHTDVYLCVFVMFVVYEDN